MPIFDEGLNMKGVVRVAACWSTSFPRRVKVTLQGVQDLPEDQEANEVACRVVTKSGMVQATPAKSSLMAGCAELKSTGLDQLEMQDEQDRLTVEVLVYGKEECDPSAHTTPLLSLFSTAGIRKYADSL